MDSELRDFIKKSGLKAANIVGVESPNNEVLKGSNRSTIKQDDQLIKRRELEKIYPSIVYVYTGLSTR